MVAAAGVSDLPRHRAYAFLWSVRVPDREISLIFNASRIFWGWQEGGENIFQCLQFVKTFLMSKMLACYAAQKCELCKIFLKLYKYNDSNYLGLTR